MSGREFVYTPPREEKERRLEALLASREAVSEALEALSPGLLQKVDRAIAALRRELAE